MAAGWTNAGLRIRTDPSTLCPRNVPTMSPTTGPASPHQIGSFLLLTALVCPLRPYSVASKRQKVLRQMLKTTVDVIRAGLNSDPTISANDRVRLLTMLRNGTDAAAAPIPSSSRVIKVLRREEAADVLGRSLRFVDSLARRGLLRRVKLPDRKRACGVRADDVAALIEQYTVLGGAQ